MKVQAIVFVEAKILEGQPGKMGLRDDHRLVSLDLAPFVIDQVLTRVVLDLVLVNLFDMVGATGLAIHQLGAWPAAQ